MLLASILPLQALLQDSPEGIGNCWDQQFMWWALLTIFCEGMWVLESVFLPLHINQNRRHKLFVEQRHKSTTALSRSFCFPEEWSLAGVNAQHPLGAGKVVNYGEALSTVESQAWTDNSLQLLPAEVQGWQNQALLNSGRWWYGDQEQQFAAWEVQLRQWKTKSKGMMQSVNRYPERKC